MSIVLETTLGDLHVDLYVNQCPVLCYNFIKLCKMKCYNFSLFHSIQKGFVAQTGDPSGLGKGGSSIFGIVNGPERRYFKEIRAKCLSKHTRPGLLSMVNCGDDMFGSQFFITLGSNLHSLDSEHLVFGEVVNGSDVLLRFNEVITDNLHRPYKDVRVTHTVIIDDPFEDPDHMLVPSRSPSPNEEILRTSRLDPCQPDSSDESHSESEKVEKLKEKDALAQATILEMIGDLPSYDVAPPENVLFVCHLNPVTTDEDLEIIFSRFGTIKSSKVIRDGKSGDSLQYAFIEFEGKQACEEAYIKMEGVVIDERRIHVDFGQSVAKYIHRKGAGEQTEGHIRKITPRDFSGRRKLKGGAKDDEQQSGKGFHRKESRRNGDRHSTSRKHDSRRRKPFPCNENEPQCRDGSCPSKEEWQEHSKSRQDKHHRKQTGNYFEYVRRDKTERGSSKICVFQSEGHRRRRASRERSYDDESKSKKCEHVSAHKKQKQ